MRRQLLTDGTTTNPTSVSYVIPIWVVMVTMPTMPTTDDESDDESDDAIRQGW
jgi:hypothetical protein